MGNIAENTLRDNVYKRGSWDHLWLHISVPW